MGCDVCLPLVCQLNVYNLLAFEIGKMFAIVDGAISNKGELEHV